MRRLCLHKNGLQAHATGKPLGLAKKCPNACVCPAGRDCTFGLVKECLGWHSECYTRRVPTRRISITHRTNLARRRPKYNRTNSYIALKERAQPFSKIPLRVVNHAKRKSNKLCTKCNNRSPDKKKNAFFWRFSSLTPMFWEFVAVILHRIWKTRLFNCKIWMVMEDSVMSLVMDTISVFGMFFIAAILLCI